MAACVPNHLRPPLACKAAAEIPHGEVSAAELCHYPIIIGRSTCRQERFADAADSRGPRGGLREPKACAEDNLRQPIRPGSTPQLRVAAKNRPLAPAALNPPCSLPIPKKGPGKQEAEGDLSVGNGGGWTAALPRSRFHRPCRSPPKAELLAGPGNLLHCGPTLPRGKHRPLRDYRLAR